jgi:amidohydrolase
LLSDIKKAVINEIDKEKERYYELSKKLHQNPELGLREYKAAKLLTSELEKDGFKIEYCFMKIETAFKGEFKGNSESPIIALLAEYDALPEIGHGCGHNFIAISTLAAALAVSKAMKKLDGKLIIIGTPDEEGTAKGSKDSKSKVKMVNNGVFDNIDAVIEIHPYSKNAVDSKFLALDAIEIIFRGKAAHAAASPEKGINALDAVIQTFNGINALRQHLREDHRIHGIVTNGGKAPNIVPEKAAAFFFIRSADREYSDLLLKRIKACAEGAASATGAKMTFKILPNSLESMKTNNTLSRIFEKNLRDLGSEIEELKEHEGKGSSDIGNVSQVVPTIHPFVSVGSKNVVLHSREFAEATVSKSGLEAMITASKAIAMTCVELFFNHKIIEDAKEEFQN